MAGDGSTTPGDANPSTSLIGGTPTAAASGTATITARDTAGANGSTLVAWTVAGSGGGNAIVNGGFEAGSLSGWSTTGATSVTSPGVHSGSYAGMVGSMTPSSTSSISQSFKAASGNTTLSFWYDNVCPDIITYDRETATLQDTTTNTTETVVAKTCSNPSSGWKQITASIAAGHSYTLTLTSHDDNYPGDPTYARYDDITTS